MYMISYRDLKSVDATLLSASIASSTISDVFDISYPLMKLSKNHSDILHKHAPIKTRPVPSSHTFPWYTPELRALKVIGRHLEAF